MTISSSGSPGTVADAARLSEPLASLLDSRSTVSKRGQNRPHAIRALAGLSACLWISLVITILVQSQAYEPYWFFVTARISQALATGFWLPVSYTPGSEMLVIQTSLFTGLPLRSVVFLPVGGMLVPLLMYALCRRLAVPRLPAYLLALCSVLSIARDIGAYSTFVGAWGNVLLFAFLISFVGMVKGSSSRTPWIFLSALLFLGLHITYYAAELLGVLFATGFLVFATLLARRSRSVKNAYRTPSSLSVAFLAMFFTFNEIMYNSFFARLSQPPSGQSFAWISAQFESLLHLQGASSEPFRLLVPLNGLLDSFTLVLLATIAAPCLVFVALFVRSIMRRSAGGKRDSIWSEIIVWSFASLVSGEFAVNFLLGTVNFQTFILVLPVAGLLVLTGYLRGAPAVRKKATVAFAAALLIVSSSWFLVAAATDNLARPSQLSQLEPGARWFLSALHGRPVTALTDLDTGSRFQLFGVEMGMEFSWVSYDSLTYGAVVGSIAYDQPMSGIGYVIVDLVSLRAATISINWKVFQPLNGYYPFIERNPHLHNVYDDGSVAIFASSP